MKAVLFQARSGGVSVEEVPAPQLTAGRVLVQNEFSLISAGTERSTVGVGQQGLIGKARQRPDQARQVVQNLRQAGLAETVRLVNDRLNTPSILGYSSAGTVLRVGESVPDIAVGSRVAAAGAGYASHAEIVAVPRNLCCLVPDEVPSRFAAFSTVGAIALRGIHQAETQPGSRVAVVGLGLVGQLTVRLLGAYGYDVVGIDPDESMLDLAAAVGVTALARDVDNLEHTVRRHWGRAGADAVLVTAAAKSADPIELAGRIARDRATVVVVGDVLVAPPRSSYYGKELTVRYSRSYGPGRYDPSYEEWGNEYPEGFVAWPLRRNMEEFLRLTARGLDLKSLEPVVFPADEAVSAYALLDTVGPDRRVAILLSYPRSNGRVPHGVAASPGSAPAPARENSQAKIRVAAVGAGSFPTRMLFPHLKRNQHVDFGWLTTGRGITAPYQCRRWGFRQAVAGLEDGLERGGADLVMVLGPHVTHADQAVKVLGAGLALFCEKPLALNERELEAVAAAWLAGNRPAMVGFNRRYAPSVQRLLAVRRGHPGPIQVAYRVFAGTVRGEHWLVDPAQGGRILGEACHFIDLAGLLAGSQPLTVSAASGDGRVDPVRTQSASIQVSYRNGSTASITYAGLTPRGAPKELIEVAGDGFAAQIDDFKQLTVWSGRTKTFNYRGARKGHGEEMDGLVALLGGRNSPESDFVSSLWSTLVTCRAGRSMVNVEAQSVVPESLELARALGVEPGLPAAEDERQGSRR